MHASLLLLSLIATSASASATEQHIANRDSQALADAFAAASARPDLEHKIVLAEGGLYTLEQTGPGRLGLPAIRGRLEIDGRGAEIRRYSSGPMTLLQIEAGAKVRLVNLTLAEGNLGAVRNLGDLTLDRVRISDSSGEAARGIIVNHGQMRIEDSELSHNEVHGSGRDAGTVLNYGRLVMSDTRVVNNSLSRRYPSLATAAVLNYGWLHLNGSSFEGNTVLDEHGGLSSAAVLNLLGGQVEGDSSRWVSDERIELVAH